MDARLVVRWHDAVRTAAGTVVDALVRGPQVLPFAAFPAGPRDIAEGVVRTLLVIIVLIMYGLVFDMAVLSRAMLSLALVVGVLNLLYLLIYAAESAGLIDGACRRSLIAVVQEMDVIGNLIAPERQEEGLRVRLSFVPAFVVLMVAAEASLSSVWTLLSSSTE